MIVFSRILTAPYEERDGWELNVMRINNLLYLEEHLSDKRLAEKSGLIELYLAILLTAMQRRYDSSSSTTLLLRLLFRIFQHIIPTTSAGTSCWTSHWVERGC